MAVLHIFAVRESFGPLCRVQAFVLTRLTSFNCGAEDIRWAIVALALHALRVAWAFGQRLFGMWARRVLRRAWQGARFAADMADADSMVAAGGR
jgi:hypothetical protein